MSLRVLTNGIKANLGYAKTIRRGILQLGYLY